MEQDFSHSGEKGGLGRRVNLSRLVTELSTVRAHKSRQISFVVLVSVLTLSLLLSSSVRVSASPLIVDQQCAAVGGGSLSGVGIHEPAGQIFKPGQTSIVAFSIYMKSINTAATSMTANIRLGGIGGAVLGSFLFSVPSGFGGASGDWLLVQFPSGIQVTPGATYAIDLIDNSGSSGIQWSTCSTPYSGGCGYSNGYCASASSWAFIDYAGDFGIGLSSSTLTLVQGSTGTVRVDVSSSNNFASPVTLSFSGASGISGSFNANPVTPTAGGTVSSTFTVFVPGSVAVGTYPLTITGSSGPLGHSATLTLEVIAGSAQDFSATSTTAIILAPGSIATAPIIVASFGGFSSSVTLSGSWVGTAPSNVAFTLPTPVTPPAGGSTTATLAVNAGVGASIGTYTLLVTGTSGSLTHSLNVDVFVVPAVTTTTTSSIASDFSLSATSSSISMIQGVSGSTTIIVTSQGGFNSPVIFSASWVGNSPSGISFSLPSPISPPPGGSGSSPMAVATSSTASPGTYTLRVMGTSQSLSHTVDITVQVTQPGPRCIIATATYGSELAPEVQLLRNFRDNGIMKTQAGSSFMLAFNAWYYSFSPNVATYIANHWVERTIMKGVLYPLVGMLALSYGIFNTASSFPEFAAVLGGLMASSMIGAFYIGLPVGLLRTKLRRLRGLNSKPIQTLLGIALLVALGGLNLGELLASPMVLTLSAASVVLSTLFLSASLTSSRLASLLSRRR